MRVVAKFGGTSLGSGDRIERAADSVANAVEAGHEALTLDVDSANERAIHVYRKMGFETVDSAHADLEMRLSFEEATAEQVRLPPAQREAHA